MNVAYPLSLYLLLMIAQIFLSVNSDIFLLGFIEIFIILTNLFTKQNVKFCLLCVFVMSTITIFFIQTVFFVLVVVIKVIFFMLYVKAHKDSVIQFVIPIIEHERESINFMLDASIVSKQHKNEKCSICYKKLNKKSVRLNCLHLFHYECIKQSYYVTQYPSTTLRCSVCGKSYKMNSGFYKV